MNTINTWAHMSLLERCRWIHATIMRKPIVCRGPWRMRPPVSTMYVDYACEECHGSYRTSVTSLIGPPQIHGVPLPNYGEGDIEGRDLLQHILKRGYKDDFCEMFLAYLAQQCLPSEDESASALVQMLKMATGLGAEQMWRFLNLTPEQVCTAAYASYEYIQQKRESSYPEQQQFGYRRLRHMMDDDGIPLFARIGPEPGEAIPESDLPYLFLYPSTMPMAYGTYCELLFSEHRYGSFTDDSHREQALLDLLRERHHWRTESLNNLPFFYGRAMYRRVLCHIDYL